MSLLGYGVATPDEALRGQLPCPATGIDRNAIPAALRRRASQATQLAFSAATEACRRAGRSPAQLPTVFACVGGEIQVTDALCIELAKPDGLISPTAFHNSVHNTAAGYWSIVHGCTLPASALAAGHETFAMALVECWTWLATQGGEMLLVCYDEAWPTYLASPMGAPPFAAALVLGAGSVAGGVLEIGRPHDAGEGDILSGFWADLAAQVPVAAALPLLEVAGGRREAGETLISTTGWVVKTISKGGSGL
ncbi:beta-ketoacyl synthase chain length factor [Methylomagnum sp.]